MPLNFGGQKRSGVFDTVWPSAILQIFPATSAQIETNPGRQTKPGIVLLHKFRQEPPHTPRGGHAIGASSRSWRPPGRCWKPWQAKRSSTFASLAAAAAKASRETRIIGWGGGGGGRAIVPRGFCARAFAHASGVRHLEGAVFFACLQSIGSGKS